MKKVIGRYPIMTKIVELDAFRHRPPAGLAEGRPARARGSESCSEVRRVVVDVIELDGNTLVDSTKENVLVMANRNAFEFSSRSDDLEETLELRALFER